MIRRSPARISKSAKTAVEDRPWPDVAQPKKRVLLAAYAECGNVSEAAKLAKVGRRSHSRWLSNDPAYAAAFDEAREEAADSLEREAIRRARDGVDEPVFWQGQMCGTVRKYSDTLLIFLLKGARPEKYRERYDHQHTGKDGGPIAMETTDAARDRVTSRIAGVASRLRESGDPGGADGR